MALINNVLSFYDYEEIVGFVPKKYDCDIEISGDDKIISITEDGELLGKLGLVYENNILSLIGKEDDLEISSIELPNSLVQLVSFEIVEGEDGKEIELSFLQSNGEETSMSLNIEELATIYKAGVGLSLDEETNTFNLNYKKDGVLEVNENNELDVNLEKVYSSIEDVNGEFAPINERLELIEQDIKELKCADTDLAEYINALATKNCDLKEEFNTLSADTLDRDEALEIKIEESLEYAKGVMQALNATKEDLKKTDCKVEDLIVIADNLEKEVLSAKTELSQHAQDIASVTELANTNASAIEELGVAIDENKSAIEAINNSMPTKFSDLENDLGFVDEEAIANVNGVLDDIKGDINTINQTIQEDEVKVSLLATDLSQLNESVSSLNDTLIATNAQASVNKNNIASLDERLSANETLANELSGASVQQSEAIGVLDGKIVKLTSEMVSASTKVSNFESELELINGTLSTHTSGISSLQETDGALEERIIALEAKNTTLITNVNAVNEEIGNINNTLESVFTDIETVSRRNSELKTISDERTSLLADILARLSALEAIHAVNGGNQEENPTTQGPIVPEGPNEEQGGTSVLPSIDD